MRAIKAWLVKVVLWMLVKGCAHARDQVLAARWPDAIEEM